MRTSLFPTELYLFCSTFDRPRSILIIYFIFLVSDHLIDLHDRIWSEPLWAHWYDGWYMKPPKLKFLVYYNTSTSDTLKPVLILVWISLIDFNNWSDKHHMTKSTSSFNFLLNLFRAHLFRIACFSFWPPSKLQALCSVKHRTKDKHTEWVAKARHQSGSLKLDIRVGR